MRTPGDLELLRRTSRLFETLRQAGDPYTKLEIVLDTTIELAGASCAFIVSAHAPDRLRVAAARKPGAPMPVDERRDASIVTRVLARDSSDTFIIVPLVSGGDDLGYVVMELTGPGRERATDVLKAFVPYAVHAIDLIQRGETDEDPDRVAEPPEPDLFPSVVGESGGMVFVKARLDKFRRSELPILVTGETGTGKEVVARAAHDTGPRHKRRFVAFNASALAETLLESELFGHAKGAFTGADQARPGLFQQAHKGTLFIDEIGDASLGVQVKLLRALESHVVRPVGGIEDEPAAVRIVAATNKDLQEEVRKGTFREDLYHRLSTLRVHLPPLRHRGGDRKLLTDHFLARMAAERGEKPRRVSDEARVLIERYDWPGNVRELRQTLERACVLGGEVLEPKDLELELGGQPLPPRSRTRSLTREELRHALVAAGWNIERAGLSLGVSHMTVRRRMEEWGITRPRPP